MYDVLDWRKRLIDALRSGQRRRRRRSSPPAAAEVLEPRALLTAFVVNSLDDGAPVADGQLTLREALTAANTNAASGDAAAGEADRRDGISFAAELSGTITLTQGQLAITEGVVIAEDIEGDRVTIDAGGANRALEIDTPPGVGPDQSVLIMRLAITGGDITGDASSEGGGIAIRADSRVILSDVTVSGGRAERGGGIFNAGHLQLGGWIHRNSADFGGGIYNAGGTLQISVSAVGANRADQTAEGAGGGIYSTGGLVTLFRSVVGDNVAARDGGGIEVLAGRFELNASLVTGNRAGRRGETSTGRGGGVRIAGPDVEAVVFRTRLGGNFAVSEGGGLWIVAGGSADISESIVSLNSVAPLGALDRGRGGGIFNDGGGLRVVGSVITGNQANGDTPGAGGGIFSAGGSVFAYLTTISGNSAWYGGGIEAVAGRVVLDHSALADNRAFYGGGLRMSGEGAVTVVHLSDVRNNLADDGGGLWNGADGTLTIDRSYVQSNTARGDGDRNGGGGIFNDGGDLLVHASIVTRNRAAGITSGNSSKDPQIYRAGRGGGIYSSGGEVVVYVSTISRNSAVVSGGGVEVLAGRFILDRSVLRQNDAGPGVSGFIDYYFNVSVGRAFGGGLHVGGAGATVYVYFSEVLENSATSGLIPEGGGLWNQAGSTLIVERSTVSGNDASESDAEPGEESGRGDGIFNNHGELVLIDSVILDSVLTDDSASGTPL